jgi:hypothetical protein
MQLPLIVAVVVILALVVVGLLGYLADRTGDTTEGP